MKLKSKIKNHLISQIDFRRLFDILPYQFAKFPNKAALVQKQNLGWQKFSTDECITQINRVSAGLLNLGLKRGEKIAIMTQVGSPRWNFLDFGAQQVGGVLVPIHAQARTHEIEYILNDAGVKFLVVANREFYERVIPLTEKVVSLKRVFTLEKLPEIPHFDKVKNAALNAGALGCSISGSGPSIFSLSKGIETAKNVKDAINNIYKTTGIDFDMFVCKINTQGMKIIR